MSDAEATCRASCTHEIGRRVITIENELLSATLLPDRGGDIYQLISKPHAMDVLWKPPWAAQRTIFVPSYAPVSAAEWLNGYPGGWQVILPSGGGPCVYQGVEMGFHGEASVTSWDYRITQAHGPYAQVEMTTRLVTLPLRVDRVVRVEARRAALIINETITNEGGASVNFMWGHHPTFGGAFLDESCRIDVGAKSLRADAKYDGPCNPMTPGEVYAWPNVQRDEQRADLTMIPPKDRPRHLYGYLQQFDEGWFGLTNTRLGFGVGMAWPIDVFPLAWLWQELSGSPGFPWYNAARCMAIEPFTSYPGHGLTEVVEKTQTHRSLSPGESLSVRLITIFYESRTGVRRISPDGQVEVRS